MRLSSAIVVTGATLIPTTRAFVVRSRRTLLSKAIQCPRPCEIPSGLVLSDSQTTSESTDKEIVEMVSSNPMPTREELLDQSLSRSTSSKEAAKLLLDELSKQRKRDETNGIINGNADGKESQVEIFLNELLDLIAIDDSDSTSGSSTLPWWTGILWTSKVSKRARRASLRRVLEYSMPREEESGDDSSPADKVEATKRRQRRTLVNILRSLANVPTPDTNNSSDEGLWKNREERKKFGIRTIETSARREMNNNKSTDLVSRVPEGLETPKYDVIVKRSFQSSNRRSVEMEIRNYSAFSVCAVPMMKARPKNSSQTDKKLSNPQLAGASSFGALAGYLFGKNQDSKSMSMTTPVLTVGDGDEKEMSFVMPSDFWGEGSLDKAPKPMKDSLVQLKRQEGGTRAVIMFGGFAGKGEVEYRRKQLLEGVNEDTEWIVESDDSPITLAQYNDPFTPPWKRRNEVSVPVVPLER